MIGRLNHVAIAVRDIAKASQVYKTTLGAEVSETVPQHEHGVSTVFITLPNTKIELLEPLGDNSTDPEVSGEESRRWHPPHLLRGGRYHRRPRLAEIKGCARDRRWRAEDRRAWQAGIVPASEGFLRHARRTRTSVVLCVVVQKFPSCCCKSGKGISEPKPLQNHKLAGVLRIRSSPRIPQRVLANFGFGTLAA